ncbi:ABC transporter permease [Jiella avicenniae]|uniref:ABC transporter permease n=1 Tax=Jiella avicenniae TaxID=2907202 RepID=A0A9X1P3H7_9HYPH|nr:ABC transporter permease [Jiella avicenniae]MCE7029813.1 ABC transporter permease [Jiella avicenniae]
MSAHAASRPRILTATFLIGPATFIAGLGVIGPMLYLLRYSFNKYDPMELMIETFTLSNYGEFFTSPYYLGAYLTTLRVGLISTAICLVSGFPLAYVLARSASRFKNLMIIGIVVPLFVGNAVRAAGWMSFLGSRGLLSVTLMKLGLTDGPTDFMYTEGTVIVGIVAVNLPYMVLSLQSVLEGINRNVEEAAFSLGAPPLTMARRVLLPLALPGIAAGTILTFILAMNAYATPVLLGGPSFNMLAPLVYGQFQLNNWPSAAAVAFVLMATTLLLTILVAIITRQKFREG